MNMRILIRWLLFPGPNLHARLRYALLPRHFGRPAQNESTLVLDAGCGNGMLAYKSCKLGNNVIAVGIKDAEIAKCHGLFNEFLGIREQQLSFKKMNLYDIETLDRKFDEIICSEVLEHIVRDEAVGRSFRNMLKPGGILHLCCPNAEHPDNARKELDLTESGGHVRPGYTLSSCRALLEPLGFRIDSCIGLGGPIRQLFNRNLMRIFPRSKIIGTGLFLLSLPFLLLDSRQPRAPYSLYVKAVAETPGPQ